MLRTGMIGFVGGAMLVVFMGCSGGDSGDTDAGAGEIDAVNDSGATEDASSDGGDPGSDVGAGEIDAVNDSGVDGGAAEDVGEVTEDAVGGDGAVDPIILEFSVNPSTVSQDESAVFYALVTDPQGISDLIGGSLKSGDGTTIAAFASSADEGSYSASVTFDTLTEAFAQDTLGNSGTMTLTGIFYDQSGHNTSNSVDVTLECDGPNQGLCDEGCVNVSSDEQNCGACDTVCATKQAASGLAPVPSGMGVCTSGNCLAATECVEASEATLDTCEDVCGAASTTCAGMVFYWNGGFGTSGIPCTDFKEYVPKSATNFCIVPMSDILDNPTPSGVSGGCICEL